MLNHHNGSANIDRQFVKEAFKRIETASRGAYGHDIAFEIFFNRRFFYSLGRLLGCG
ncbi:hypothetical protein [Methylomonas koyamae]|uniref:hypothetical protein n=1 Tax=Methylomonas koyamae TaxID=702114 RepID=UPI001FD296C5|nr:hypothetical protein [Methylomonas koyamae]